MKAYLRENLILSVALLVGLIAALCLCATRAGLEANHTGVSLIMTRSDVLSLANAEGIDAAEYEKQLLDAGLSAVFTPGEVCEELSLYIGESYHGESATVGMPEDDRQFSHDEIEGFTYSDEGDVVRVFRLRPEYAARYASLGYTGPEEIENLTYRTITDRNVRVIWLCPFTRADNGELVSDIGDYVSVIQGVGERIEGQGLHLGQFSTLPGYEPNPILIFGVILSIAAAGVILFASIIPLGKSWGNILLAVLFICGCLVHTRLSFAMPLCASIAYPCLGVWLIAELLSRLKALGRGSLLLAYLGILLGGITVAVVGGNIVGAMQSSRSFMLAVENFRGVKLSQAVPMLYAIFICIKTFYRGWTPREVLGEYRNSRKAALVIVFAMAAAAALYILRLGDGTLSAGVLEQLFRNFLEKTLIVRPRSKEFLFAWPALGAAIVLISRGSRRYCLPFAILSSVGLASVVNTFCHSRSPLWLALARTGMGTLIGFAIGAVIILVLAPRKSAENPKKE